MIRILESAIDDVRAVLRARTVKRDEQSERVVAEIIADVRRRGDAALLDNARRFDAPGLERLEVTEEELTLARIPKRVMDALEVALLQVQAFHSDQLNVLTEGWHAMELDSVEARRRSGQPLHLLPNFEYRWHKEPLRRPGNTPVAYGGGLGQRLIPLQRAGVYVPGGNATYPSSVIMNVIPAQAAGVNAVFVTTPARSNGTLHPAVLAALAMSGVARAYKVGGAAAIAGLALGTETIPRVDKIVGPGNRYVNEAKRQLWGQVGLDGYAGPSEVCVLVDDTANVPFAVADFLTQIEHAPDNAGFLVTLSRAMLDEILAEVERQLESAPRAETMRQALAADSLAIVARDLEEAIDLVNEIAPEHLTLALQAPEEVIGRIRNAGSIFMGEHTPESAGDFCLGPSHTLPTSGAARWQSPVSVLDFLKVQSLARLTPKDLEPLIPVVEAFGEMEGFPAHAYGASVRRDAS
ncbi:MAG: histidinol dehydrogenase [Fimbriimonas sp.]